MTVQMSAKYMRPFSQMNVKRAKPDPAATLQSSRKESKEDLQLKRQSLQNQLLLLKSGGTDTAGAGAENQKALEAQLEEVTSAIRSAKSSCPQPVDNFDEKASTQDSFRFQGEKKLSYGTYRIEKDEKGYQVLFSPYSDA